MGRKVRSRGAAAIYRLRLRIKAIVNAHQNVPCKDCGNIFPVCCMDFDHVRGEKLGDICGMANSTLPIARILDEIQKCEVVCSNCHRIRTVKRLRAREIAENSQLDLYDDLRNDYL